MYSNQPGRGLGFSATRLVAHGLGYAWYVAPPAIDIGQPGFVNIASIKGISVLEKSRIISLVAEKHGHILLNEKDISGRFAAKSFIQIPTTRAAVQNGGTKTVFVTTQAVENIAGDKTISDNSTDKTATRIAKNRSLKG